MTTASTTEVGSIAPDFTLQSTNGKISLSDYRNRENVVLFFMREFSCPLCQKHVAQLRQMYNSTLQAQKTTVLVVGGGSLEDAQRLAQRLQLNFPVIADPQREVYEQYGLSRALGVWQRSGTVLIDTKGVIRAITYSANPSASLDREELLGELAKLN